MKKLYRNFIGAVAIASLAICMLPGLEVRAATVTPVNVPASGTMSIAELQQAFPKGTYWNKLRGQTGETAFQVTNTPCNHNSGDGEMECNDFSNGSQCAGFANMMAYLYRLGTGVSRESLDYIQFEDVDDIQVGDIIRADDHSVFVTEVLGGRKFRTAEGNYGYTCKINWGRVVDVNKFEYIDALYRAYPGGTLEKYMDDLGKEEYGTVFRFYNPRSGAHVYTSDNMSAAGYLATGWVKEISAGLAETGEGGRAIYQLRNNTTREILYTGDSNEVKVLSNRGWTVENDEFPVFHASDSGTKHVYRLYCPNNPPITSHHYTSDLNEIKVLTQERGYVQDNGGKPIFSLR